MRNRFVRDALVLIIFCAIFYAVTLTINWFGSGQDQVQAHEFSWDRTKADQFSAKKDWPSAAVHFQKLTESDQFNGHAWYFLGDSHFRCRHPLVRTVYREEIKPNPDADRITKVKAEARELTEKAAVAFRRAIDFPRYRNKSRFRLARMYAFDGENDLAMQYLKEALQDGFISNTKFGFKDLYEFSAIRENPAFLELTVLERQNRARRYQRRNSN